jgi:glycosyltransferase involved in cell wall biosynthesis
MRVLHVGSGNLFGGIEALLLTLARQRGLCPDLEPHFALCFAGRLSRELGAAGVAVRLLGAARASRPWTVWRARRRLRELLTQRAFDVVICHGCWPHALFAPVVRRRGLPLVFWAHDRPGGRHWTERWAGLSRPDLVLANSLGTRAGVPGLFPGVRSAVAYLPVAPPAVPDRDEARRQVREALGTPGDAVVVVMASRLEPLKGHAVLLAALAALAGVPGWVCWVAGGTQRPDEAAYLAGLRAAAARAGLGGRVRFLGQRADVPRLLAAADVYCQPNTGPESFGVAFVEALYAGLPVVTSAHGGALEIVHDGCGILVPPRDVPALADALARLIGDPDLRRRQGQGGPARAAELCDPAVRMAALGELLRAARRSCSASPSRARSAAE